jgi:UDP-N-acetylmuramyl pentapeptide phosphotransferase/UDP-N-acetylglucosamine-1-phosphate transferase
VQLNPTIQFVLTITWIFGVTTVINWSDGMDGLAGGLSLISAITFFIAALILNQTESALVSIILVGTILGFLYYNKFPAKVFMGDAGANFLGFALGAIAVNGAFKSVTAIGIIIPMLALGVPIFDTIFNVVRRVAAGQPFYVADKGHTHHQHIAGAGCRKAI